jgi:hypothetical protein
MYRSLALQPLIRYTPAPLKGLLTSLDYFLAIDRIVREHDAESRRERPEGDSLRL